MVLIINGVLEKNQKIKNKNSLFCNIFNILSYICIQFKLISKKYYGNRKRKN